MKQVYLFKVSRPIGNKLLLKKLNLLTNKLNLQKLDFGFLEEYFLPFAYFGLVGAYSLPFV